MEVGTMWEGAAWARASAGFRLLGRGGRPGSSGPTACTGLRRPGRHGIKASGPREVSCPKTKFRGGV